MRLKRHINIGNILSNECFIASFKSPSGPATFSRGAAFTADKNSDYVTGSLHQPCALAVWSGNTVSDCTSLSFYSSLAKLNHSSFDIEQLETS